MGEKESIFSKLTPQEIARIKRESRLVEIKKGSILFYQGDICNEVLYLLEGKIQLFVGIENLGGNNFEEIPLYEFCQNEQCIVNIASALSKSPTLASAVAKTDIKAYLMPIALIEELIATSKPYRNFIFSLFTLRFASLTTLIEHIKFKKLDSRILEYLQGFGVREIHITNAEIAEHLGTSRAVINRVLQDLKRKGFIKLNRGKITLNTE